MQASNIQGKSFAICNSLLSEAREIWSRRSSWQVYDSFCQLKALPQMNNHLQRRRKTLVQQFRCLATISSGSKIETPALQFLKDQTSKLKRKTEVLIVCVQARLR